MGMLGALGLIGAILGSLNTAAPGTVALATYHFDDVARDAERLLIEAGIKTELENKGGTTILYVQERDAQAATRLLLAHPEILKKQHNSTH